MVFVPWKWRPFIFRLLVALMKQALYCSLTRTVAFAPDNLVKGSVG